MMSAADRRKADQTVVGFCALHEITRILGDRVEPSRAMNAILKILGSFMGMAKGAICLFDAQRRELTIEAAFGLTDEERRRGRYRTGEGITGKVAKLGIPMVVPDMSKEPYFLNKTRSRSAPDLQGMGFICVPIKVAGDVIGVLSVERPTRDARRSIEEDLRVLAIVASLLGHSVRLHHERTRAVPSLDGWKELREFEREMLIRALKETGGVQVKAAARLGITPRQLAYKIQKYRIIKEFRLAGESAGSN